MKSTGDTDTAERYSRRRDPATYVFDLFVVFAAADADFVRGHLLPALNVPSSRVLLVDELTLGASIVSEIDRGVSCSRFTVVVLSPAYLEARWAAFGEQLASYFSIQDVHVIPLQLVDFKLPLRLEARVALDFTDRTNWRHETERLRELLNAIDTSSVANDGCGSVGLRRSAAVSHQLELVDASFAEDELEHRGFSCPILDLKMINRSMASIVVKRVDVYVQTSWKIPEKDMSNMRFSQLGQSASYDLRIPDRDPPFVLSKQVSHVLRPDEADRFRISFHREAIEGTVLSMIVKAIHGSRDSEVSSGELLCAFDGLDRFGTWDEDAQRGCARLAHAIRQRNAHMSKRLFDLLEEMDTAGQQLKL